MNNGDSEASQVIPLSYHRSGEENVPLIAVCSLPDIPLPPLVLLIRMLCSGALGIKFIISQIKILVHQSGKE